MQRQPVRKDFEVRVGLGDVTEFFPA